jgi:hypothetical protein
MSSHAYAGYITTDLTEDNYISYQGYDWTWASPVNETNYDREDFVNGRVINTFQDADFHTGWMDIVNTIADPNLEQLFASLSLDNFKDASGNIIHSVAYWNSYFTTVDELQFGTRLGQKNDTPNSSSFYFETFYVRASVAPTTNVPEPATLFILAIGLVGVAIRQKVAK